MRVQADSARALGRLVLVGGGPDTVFTSNVTAPFISACRDAGANRVFVGLAGDAGSVQPFVRDYERLLVDLAAHVDVVPLAAGLTESQIREYDAFVIGGGPTPAYWAALSPLAHAIRQPIFNGAPFLGFSAGAMLASDSAIIGGHQSSGRSICPVEWSEGIDDLDVREGLRLVPWAVDVHAAQAGTLGRVVETISRGLAPSGVAIDEDTSLVIDPAGTRVAGSGHAWWANPGPDGVAVLAESAS